MADLIQVLSDSVANQIAAGEVIQRPASVVKELMENCVDAGASEIKVIVKDAGKTSIQVIDNGAGMSPTDARLAFERHSTSKIHAAEDLFSIQTMGFRGEALASVAAIAHVELKTKRMEDEIGTRIRIEGSQVVDQEPVQCPDGSNFIVRNLFYNVPARRKFLKKDSTELNHIIQEFKRVALSHTDLSFSLIHNNVILYKLNPAKFGKRIVDVFGENMRDNLIPVRSDTRIVSIMGYIGRPEKAKKRGYEQFFFVNSRFMKNPYLHKAIMNAYEKIIPQGVLPAYFINLKANPDTLDVNIHPTKTEVKFEDQQAVWQILHASVKEALGKNHIVPSIDFDQQGNIGIPPLMKNREVSPPSVQVDPNYNPFEDATPSTGRTEKKNNWNDKENLRNWEKLYHDFEQPPGQKTITMTSRAGSEAKGESAPPESRDASKFFQFKGSYILTPVKSGLMIINQHRAHTRILYEYYVQTQKNRSGVIQKQLYPEAVQLNNSDYNLLKEIKDEVKKIGIEVELKGSNVVEVRGIPAESDIVNPAEVVESLLEQYGDNKNFGESLLERIALSLAGATAIQYGRVLEQEEMRELLDRLFACSAPNYTPDGQKVISFIKTEEIEKLFK
ncbi:MAG: DNA mismatch repair endonuclease MutL [Bacteroidales bacterium]|nr:DNA mismatch repair endonuclease MutL [Bacteroidales bacterium]